MRSRTNKTAVVTFLEANPYRNATTTGVSSRIRLLVLNRNFQLSNPFISFINFNGKAKIEHEIVPSPPIIRKVKSDEFTIFKLEAWI